MNVKNKLGLVKLNENEFNNKLKCFIKIQRKTKPNLKK